MEKLPGIERKWLFDGIGTETEHQQFSIVVEEQKIEFSLFDFVKNRLSKLVQEIGAHDFEKIISINLDFGDKSQSRYAYFLIIQNAPGSLLGCFEKIGHFSANSSR